MLETVGDRMFIFDDGADKTVENYFRMIWQWKKKIYQLILFPLNLSCPNYWFLFGSLIEEVQVKVNVYT